MVLLLAVVPPPPKPPLNVDSQFLPPVPQPPPLPACANAVSLILNAVNSPVVVVAANAIAKKATIWRLHFHCYSYKHKGMYKQLLQVTNYKFTHFLLFISLHTQNRNQIDVAAA